MATVIPYRALRYANPAELESVTTPPYDIISEKEQDGFYKKSEHNVIRLEYGKIFDTDTDSDNRYTRARETLKAWLESGVLIEEDTGAFYIYEEIFSHEGREISLKGLIGRVKLHEFSERIILPHEETLSKAKTDRFNLMCATGCNFSQIYSLYLDEKKAIPNMIAELSSGKPDISFTAFDGLRQNLWIIKDKAANDKITAEFEGKQLFIADGHHRYETALNYKKHVGTGGAADYCMMFLMEMEDAGLVVFPTHRLVRDLSEFDAAAMLEKIAPDFEIAHINAPLEQAKAALSANADKNAFLLCLGENDFYLLILKSDDAIREALPDKCDAYRELDVSVLHSLILEKALGIDKENMARQLNLTYTRDDDEAVDGVKSGKFQCSFLLNPTKVSQIKSVSLANEKMPQKSTYFYPKLVTGIVMNKINEV